MTVKELCEVVEKETEIILYFDPLQEQESESDFIFNRNNSLCMDAFGDYIIDNIRTQLYEEENNAIKIIAEIKHEVKPVRRQ